MGIPESIQPVFRYVDSDGIFGYLFYLPLLVVRAQSPRIRSGHKKKRGLAKLDRGPARPSSARRSRCLAQNFVGLPKLPVLALQRLQPVGQFSRNPGSLTAIDLRLLDPLV